MYLSVIPGCILPSLKVKVTCFAVTEFCAFSLLSDSINEIWYNKPHHNVNSLWLCFFMSHGYIVFFLPPPLFKLTLKHIEHACEIRHRRHCIPHLLSSGYLTKIALSFFCLYTNVTVNKDWRRKSEKDNTLVYWTSFSFTGSKLWFGLNAMFLDYSL